MNYAEMKEHEINAAVGEALGWNAKFIHQDDSVTFRDDLGRLRGRKNYCNSWSDAGPIIAGNFIAIVPAYEFQDESEERLKLTGRWGAESISEEAKSLVARDQNPLRAAMIVFLMMQEGE